MSNETGKAGGEWKTKFDRYALYRKWDVVCGDKLITAFEFQNEADDLCRVHNGSLAAALAEQGKDKERLITALENHPCSCQWLDDQLAAMSVAATTEGEETMRRTFCRNCGYEISPTNVVCAHCGRVIDGQIVADSVNATNPEPVGPATYKGFEAAVRALVKSVREYMKEREYQTVVGDLSSRRDQDRLEKAMLVELEEVESLISSASTTPQATSVEPLGKSKDPFCKNPDCIICNPPVSPPAHEAAPDSAYGDNTDAEGTANRGDRPRVWDEEKVTRKEVLEPSFCGVPGHFSFQQNGSTCLMCQREQSIMLLAWRDGIRIARSYGDNIIHLDYDQEQRQFRNFISKNASLILEGRSQQLATSVEAKPNQSAAHEAREGEKRERGLVCCFCGKGFGYASELPKEKDLKAAYEHEAQCPKNPYLAKITLAREALEKAELSICHLFSFIEHNHPTGNDCMREAREESLPAVRAALSQLRSTKETK